MQMALGMIAHGDGGAEGQGNGAWDGDGMREGQDCHLVQNSVAPKNTWLAASIQGTIHGAMHPR